MQISFVRVVGRLSLVLIVFSLSASSWAKEAVLTAIELFPAADGQAYAQISNVTLNGKTEVRLCSGNGPIDKSSYGKLQKVPLTAGMSLERDAQGVLQLNRGGPVSCAVPENLKLEKDTPLSASDLADRAALQGRVLSTSDGAPAELFPLKAGVKLVFVTAPDPELAEYLRADRASTPILWQKYLDKYPAGSHVAQARVSLAALYVHDGEASLAAYQQSVAGKTPNYDALKGAKTMADNAVAAAPNDDGAKLLARKVRDEVETISKRSQGELQQYRLALSAEKPGYVHLATAAALANAAVTIDAKSSAAAAVAGDTKTEQATFDAVIQTAQGQITSQNFDQALRTIAPLRAFDGENPRVHSTLHAIYSFHISQGEKLGQSGDWQAAVKEYQAASVIESNAEVAASLKTAQQQAQIAADKAAAQAALQKSQELETANDLIGAYEVVDALPPQQRSLVADRLDVLKDRYVQSASQAAMGLQKTHEPINGLTDEVGVERAYHYFLRCYALTQDPTYQDRAVSVADALATYYLAQGKRYMGRPAGIGTNVGWNYLTKAVQLKASNVDEVRDEVARDIGVYQLRSKLSIRVGFRDQTSLRDSTGFAAQLSDALATGLETSGLPIKVLRPGETTSIDPNFLLIGDVLRHELNSTSEKVAKESRYRSGEHEIPNEDWNKANRIYETATLELQTAQRTVEGANAHGKKKEIEDANRAVAIAQKKVEEAHARLDSIAKTLPEAIERPYTYTEVTTHFSEAVELQFRILDSTSNLVVPTVPLKRHAEQGYTMLEDVKPEDTTGVRVKGATLDQKQVESAFENDVRDELIKKTLEQVQSLPATLLQLASKKASEGDVDGAAELYILYLNSTPQENSAEREHARRFLVEQFNFNNLAS